MNHLGHLYLAYPNEPLMAGNFIADAVKGQAYRHFPPAIAKGIQMHRAIDHFTDRHPMVLLSKKMFKPRFGLYSGILVDITYDHFLAAGWSCYSSMPLQDFAKETYGILDRFVHNMPAQSQRILPYMKYDNWLVRYADLEGLKRTLHNFGRRLRQPVSLEDASVEIIENYKAMQHHFTSFFDDVHRYVRRQWMV